MGNWVKLTLTGSLLLQMGIAFGGSQDTNNANHLGGVNAFSTVLRGPWSAWCNPAGLASIGAPAAGLSAQRPFNLPGFDAAAGFVALPWANSGIALYAQHEGNAAFREWAAGLSYGRHLGPYLAIGLSAEYHGTSIADHGRSATVGMALGLQAFPADGWVLGAWVRNPQRPKRGPEDADRLPASLLVGVQYRLSNTLSLALEASKSPDQTLAWQAGLSVRIIESLHVQGGWRGGPNGLFLGLHYRLGSFQTGFRLSAHPVLGFSPGFSGTWTRASPIAPARSAAPAPSVISPHPPPTAPPVRPVSPTIPVSQKPAP